MGTLKRQWRTIIVVSLLALCGSLFVQQLTGLSYGASSFNWSVLAQAYTNGSISGTVTDSTTNQPIGNVWVYASATSSPWGWGSTRTAANGTYTLSNLPAGTYKVSFYTSNGAYFFQYYYQEGVWENASLVTVTAGQTTANIDGLLRNTVAPARIVVDGPNTWVDANSGMAVIRPWSGILRTFTYKPSCSNGTLQRVVLKVGTRAFPMTATTGGNYSVGVSSDIITQIATANRPANTYVTVDVTCSGVTTSPIVGIVLTDPSGNIYDSKTKQPINGATVTLYRDATRTPSNSPTFNKDTECPTTNVVAAGAWFTDTRLTTLTPKAAEKADPTSKTFHPENNPLPTDKDGYYRWDVSPGCWYVQVEARGYTTKVSPVVGVLPGADITDLDFYLDRHTYYLNLPLVSR